MDRGLGGESIRDPNYEIRNPKLEIRVGAGIFLAEIRMGRRLGRSRHDQHDQHDRCGGCNHQSYLVDQN